MKPLEEQIYRFLVSLTPQEDLARFYCFRAHCLRDWAHFHSAFALAGYARQLAPDNFGCEVLQALSHVVCRQAMGLVDYGLETPFDEEIAIEGGKRRPLEQWERRTVPEARKELERIAGIHRAKSLAKKTSVSEQVFNNYQPHQVFA